VALSSKEIFSASELTLDVDGAATPMAFACQLPATIAIAPSNAAGLFQQFKFFIRSNPHLITIIILIARQYSKKIDLSSTKKPYITFL
jgi:hypothetical protein